MKRSVLASFALLAGAPALAGGIVAAEDFDGGDINLISSSVPALDGGGGDWFGVGNRNAWPQGFPSPGVPFSIADDSVFGYANGAAFPGDDEGVFGQNSNLDNNYFAMSDTRKWTAAELTASWTFDISGASGLGISIDIASHIDGDFAYDALTNLTFTAQIDGGGSQTLLVFTPSPNPHGNLRTMDDGLSEAAIDLLFATGDATITKTFADGGSSSAAGDLYLDKSVVADGSIDAFSTSIAGSGSSLVLTMTTNMPFEAAVFDNIVVTPEPAGVLLLGLGALLLRRR